MSDAREAKTNLSAEQKRALLAQFLERKAAGAPIEMPLSHGQRALWYIHRLAPESWTYHILFAARIQGPVDVPALERALGRIVRRHPALHTTFAERQGKVVQKADPQLPLSFGYHDRAGEDGQVVTALLMEEAHRPFDLRQESVLRTVLVRQGADDYALLMVAHHIGFDFWSLGLILNELDQLYPAEREGRPVSQPEPERSYGDFVRWQNRALAGERGKALEAYWLQQLEGELPVLDLPTDRPRPALQTYNGASIPVRLDPALTAGLRGLAKRSGATLFATLLAALHTLLHRYTGSRDILVGSPMAGRVRSELESIVGYFANMVALRARLEAGGDDPTFEDLVAQMRETVMGALEHQDMPFPLLVDRLKPVRDPSRGPLFDVSFGLESPRMDRSGVSQLLLGEEGARARLAGLDLEAIPMPQQEGQFDLTFHLLDLDREIAGLVSYNTDLYDTATVQRMARVYRCLLEGIVRDPGVPLRRLPLLPAADRQQVLVEWNDRQQPATWRDALADNALESFRRQVRRRPEALAVDDGQTRVDYRTLERRASRLARQLLPMLAPGEEARVALCLPRSVDLIVAQVAVLMAGAAYVPLDDEHPDERLEFLLRDSGAAAVLTHRSLEARLGALTAVPVLCLDGATADSVEVPAAEETLPLREIHPQDAAYIIYTSGSTGQPKGVVVSHGSLIHMLRWDVQYYRMVAEDRVSHFASPAFDASVAEIWPALVVGASLHVPDPTSRASAAGMVSWFRDQRITFAFLPTPMAEAAFGLPEIRDLSLRILISAGDRLRRVPAPGVPFTLVNAYGPTENTVIASYAEIPAAEGGVPEALPPIGRIIEGCSGYLLDSRVGGGEPVPPGVPAELYLGGDRSGGSSLARGYWNRPALTAERFVPDPFSGVPGARLYRTGDLVRLARVEENGGVLEFVGRNDFQVKIRGIRIEVGEIESALAEHSRVEDAVVMPRGEGLESRLVAYVALTAEAAADPVAAEEALHQHLEAALPAYMVPPTWIFLDRLPLNASGKVDRRALPDPTQSRSLDALTAGPRGDIAQAIIGAWESILGREGIGPVDNFFDLGGHSLQLVEVQERLLKALGRSVEVVDLLRYPTVGALARHLDPEAEAAPVPTVSAAPVQADEPIAIIGWSGRFPGARSVAEFWDNLLAGEEHISFFSEDELENGGLLGGDPKDERYVKAGGVLEDVDQFDAGFFGYNPREAEILDPQQRLFLEHAWEALEDAGYEPESYAAGGGRIGVHAGVGFSSYLFFNLARNPVAFAAGGYQLLLSNEKDFLPTRVAYKLNLKGPAVSVQTACSTSLVAVHMACRALRTGECDIALAGGASVRLPQRSGYPYQEGMILSPDGHCRPFDADAGGTVGSNGVALVVLKPLSRALADGDDIRAVVRGSAINNDGSAKVSFTALSVDGQAAVIRDAVAAAGVKPEEIGFIEAHGSGTELGDSIEVAALKEVFAGVPEKSCVLGSLRSNVGHLDAAAGVAGLIKAALAVRTGQIPATLHFQKPNPKMGIEGSPFFVSPSPQAWPAAEGIRRAGVSAFGIGGTNAHLIVEQPPERVADGDDPPDGVEDWHLLPLSARSPAALEEAARRLAAVLEESDAGSPASLADIAFTLQVGRRAFEHRRIILARDRETARLALLGEIPDFPFDGDGELAAVGRRWLDGETVDWPGLAASTAGSARRRVPLPTYPFERQRYWLEPVPAGTQPDGDAVGEHHPRPEMESPFVAPRDEMEERIAALWGEMLGLAEVGIHDDFLALGGHSLLGTRILARLRQDFGVELNLSTLFRTPTVAGLAEQVRSAGESAGGRDLVPGGDTGMLAAALVGEDLDLNELSDENVEALLVGMLSDEELAR